MGDISDILIAPSKLFQYPRRFFCGECRCLGAQRRILLDGDAIMQQNGSGQHVALAAFCGVEAHGITEDTQDMGEVVGPVVTLGRMWNELHSQRLVGREGFGLEHRRHRFSKGSYTVDIGLAGESQRAEISAGIWRTA
jgi:hypothetical protein